MLGEKLQPFTAGKRDSGDYTLIRCITTAARYCQLIMKEQKEGKDFKAD